MSSTFYFHSTPHSESSAPWLTLCLHLLVSSLLAWKVPELHTPDSTPFVLFWCGVYRSAMGLTVVFFLSASFHNPGFVLPADVEDRKRLADNDNKLSELPESAVSPSKLLESLRSPKNFGLVEGGLDSTTLPPKSPKKESYIQLTEPPEIGTAPGLFSERPQKEELLPGTPNPTGDNKRVDSDATDDEHCDDIKAPQNSEIFVPENLKSDDIIIVDVRRCTVCGLEQPLRTKHCKDCGKCIALHDHHCPWLGNCVGERNRRWFYWYLVFQCSLLWLAMIFVTITQVIHSFRSPRDSTMLQWIIDNSPRVFCCLVTGLFCLMVTCLLGFHTYLAIVNQTTCNYHLGESVSWEKISYLKTWPSDLGSPFSGGCLRNLKTYCCSAIPRPYRLWKMPKRLPEKPQKVCFCC